jgi:acyl-CoA reductase-like NAD-dependent aldehyde dehydrogenase
MSVTAEAVQQGAVRVVEDLTIDGQAVRGEGQVLDVPDPATEEIFARIPSATLEQADHAIMAARRAFDDGPWPRWTGQERSAAMHRLADLLESNAEDLASCIVKEVGSPITLARAMQVALPIRTLRWQADAAAVDRTEYLPPSFDPIPSNSLVAYRPIGVVSAITAYNYPLQLAVIKIGAALAAGCTSVLLPSPRTPVTTTLLGELIREADLPPGVVNVVLGGADIGELLTTHPAVDKVTFTGSDLVGSRIMAQASATLKGVTLELGGKSPTVLLPGTDLNPQVILPIHFRYLRNAGQGCAAPTRVLVHRSQYDEFVELTQAAWSAARVGSPWEEETVVGPLITPQHRDRVQGYVDEALEMGGHVVAGGGMPDRETGWWVMPTLLGGLPNDARVAQEEIFGPVGMVMAYDDVDEAIRVANDSRYGLAAHVYGPDLKQCFEVGGQLRAGSLYINGGGGFRPDAPFGGFKASGIGREIGELGIREFLEPQHVQWTTAVTDPTRS